MIYVSHLLEDWDMRDVINRTGAGVESIEFYAWKRRLISMKRGWRRWGVRT